MRDYDMIMNYWFPSLPIFPQAQGSGDTGVESVVSEEIADFGTLYNLQGNIIKLNVEYGAWSGLDSGIYIWKSERTTNKILIP